jgi:DnaJ-class molecular chaperone
MHEREPSRRAWARRIMGIEQEEITAEALRARYRVLMMRYHPDADPSGLERCKDVNVAYSLLIAEVAGP